MKLINTIRNLKTGILYNLQKKNFPHVLSRLETSLLIQDNPSLSICRYGDGELGFLTGCNNLGFQKFNSELSNRLGEILLSADTCQDKDLLICLPNCFNTVDNMVEAPAAFWKNWVVQNKRKLSKYFFACYKYGDAFVSRLYSAWKDKSHEQEIVDNIRSAWHGKKLIIIEGAKTRFGVGNDLIDNAASVSRILCPAENAWDKYDLILSTALKFAEKDCVFALALGPTATVLSYDLHKSGYRALDLGHMDLQYEYMIRKAEAKTIIPGKYNNEVSGGNIVDDINDHNYIDSIICDLS